MVDVRNRLLFTSPRVLGEVGRRSPQGGGGRVRGSCPVPGGGRPRACPAYFASWNSVEGTQPSFPSSSVTFHQMPSLSPLG